MKKIPMLERFAAQSLVEHDGELIFSKEKFAELIVAECMEVCRQGKYGRKDDLDTIQFDNGIRFCINAIDEHFGD